MSEIDIAFDFRSDANGGDPDSTSPTLRRFHQLLWSRDLPDGRSLTLATEPEESSEGFYLYAQVEGIPEQTWGSDSILATHTRWEEMATIMAQVPDQVKDDFLALGYTIGGFLL